MEIRPEVTLPELKFEVKVPEQEVSEDQMDKELQAIVERLTTLETVVDRKAEDTDIVNIDFSRTCNGESIPGGSARRTSRLDLKNNNFIEGFATQVVGHELGETFTIDVTFPEDYQESSLAGQKAQFEIKINEINRRVVPEINDELAQKVRSLQNPG